MGTVTPFYPRRQPDVGKVIVWVAVANVLDPARRLEFSALVDTGTFGLVLPLAWKEHLGELTEAGVVEIETADRRIVTAEVRGPVRIQIEGFRRVTGEVIFVDMEKSARGYEPLVGYTVLELSGVAVDMVSHSLVARKYYPAKAAAIA